MEDGQTLLTIGHLGVERKHWVAIAVNGKMKQFGYGDSFGGRIPAKILAAYNWWISKHSNAQFELTSLLTAKQVDGFSCRILLKVALDHVVSNTKSDSSAPYDTCVA